MKRRKLTLKAKLRKRYAQTGKSNTAIDKTRVAKRVGLRRSKSGKWYTEVRRNRSDKNKKTRL